MIDNYDQVGFPAKPGKVTRRNLNSAELAHERNRKVELFPARYDDRPLYARALERRVLR